LFQGGGKQRPLTVGTRLLAQMLGDVSDDVLDGPNLPTPDFAIGFWQSWRYEVQIVNSEIRQWRPAR
jgi:hypothetical protein